MWSVGLARRAPGKLNPPTIEPIRNSVAQRSCHLQRLSPVHSHACPPRPQRNLPQGPATITVQSLSFGLPSAKILRVPFLSSGCFKVYAISHPVSRVLGHFLTSPPFYLAFKRTLDAFKFPSNGPDLPSNISDKLAQSCQAKGTADQFHSRCPTRAKTFELRTAPPSL